jgi:uncharacterized membrane protein
VPSPESRRALVAGAALALAACLAAYPLLLGPLLLRAGVRSTALALGVVAGVGLALPAPALAGVRPARWPRWGIALLLGLAALTGERRALFLVPACVYLGLAAFFQASLRGGDSLIHFAVRRALPAAPDFVGPYCRALTRLWAFFFAGCALGVAGLALWGSADAWAAWTGWRLYALMLLASGAEFLVRKTWFRYYFRGGPFDRLWSRLFPAERTARGRRSADAIRAYRAQQID